MVERPARLHCEVAGLRLNEVVDGNDDEDLLPAPGDARGHDEPLEDPKQLLPPHVGICLLDVHHLADRRNGVVLLAHARDSVGDALVVIHVMEERHGQQEGALRHDVTDHDELEHSQRYEFVVALVHVVALARRLMHGLVLRAALACVLVQGLTLRVALATAAVLREVPAKDDLQQHLGDLLPELDPADQRVAMDVVVRSDQPGDGSKQLPRVREPDALVGALVAEMKQGPVDASALVALHLNASSLRPCCRRRRRLRACRAARIFTRFVG
mmetsp:Transcript_20885/g.59646  ORF Transcript_20885/g.59646 Transcript_20885/m.59646 type:complete len:271 (-) Transcript_20885:81-893(-)